MNTKKNGRTTKAAAIVIGATLVVGLGSATAVAGDLIGSGDIKNDSVRSLDIKDGTVRQSDLTDGAQAALAGKDGERGPQGPKGEPGAAASDVLGTSVLGKTFPTTTVAEVGGSFATRSTQVGSFELQPGTYLLSTDGFFITNEATSGQTRMQVAVRGVDGSTWGSDLGTCFTGLISTLNAREATCNTTRTVVIDELTTVDVKAFGYADDQGSADSGKVDATLSVSAVKVG